MFLQAKCFKVKQSGFVIQFIKATNTFCKVSLDTLNCFYIFGKAYGLQTYVP